MKFADFSAHKSAERRRDDASTQMLWEVELVLRAVARERRGRRGIDSLRASVLLSFVTHWGLFLFFTGNIIVDIERIRPPLGLLLVLGTGVTMGHIVVLVLLFAGTIAGVPGFSPEILLSLGVEGVVFLMIITIFGMLIWLSSRNGWHFMTEWTPIPADVRESVNMLRQSGVEAHYSEYHHVYDLVNRRIPTDLVVGVIGLIITVPFFTIVNALFTLLDWTVWFRPADIALALYLTAAVYALYVNAVIGNAFLKLGNQFHVNRLRWGGRLTIISSVASFLIIGGLADRLPIRLEDISPYWTTPLQGPPFPIIPFIPTVIGSVIGPLLFQGLGQARKKIR